MRALFQAPLEAHANNIHCLALAVNQVFGALFSLSPQQDVEDRYCQIIFVRTTVNGHLFFLFHYFVLQQIFGDLSGFSD